MRVVLAPNGLAGAMRSGLVLGAILLVAALMLGAKGPPRSNRDVRRDEVRIFSPRPLVGIAELTKQMLLVVVLTWACRGPLRIRL